MLCVLLLYVSVAFMSEIVVTHGTGLTRCKWPRCKPWQLLQHTVSLCHTVCACSIDEPRCISAMIESMHRFVLGVDVGAPRIVEYLEFRRQVNGGV